MWKRPDRVQAKASGQDYAGLLEAAVARSFARPMECILCDGRAEMRGMFFPGRPSEYGAPPGKTRVIIYAICDACWKKADVLDRVEARIRCIALGLEPDRWN